MNNSAIEYVEARERVKDWTDSIPTNWIDGDLFKRTIQIFLLKEKFILDNELNERTISYKLAEHLNFAFPYHDVDCEYNRMNGKTEDEGSKYVYKELDLRLDDSEKSDGQSVFPDIVVHQRGINDNNYLVIEVKKKSYANVKRKNTEETYRDFDKRKLAAYIRELDYEWGVYIEFEGSTICELSFYKK